MQISFILSASFLLYRRKSLRTVGNLKLVKVRNRSRLKLTYISNTVTCFELLSNKCPHPVLLVNSLVQMGWFFTAVELVYGQSFQHLPPNSYIFYFCRIQINLSETVFA